MSHRLIEPLIRNTRPVALAAALATAGAALLVLPPTPAAGQYPGRTYDRDNNVHNAAVAAARGQVEAARSRLQGVVRATRAAFEADPETIEAKRQARAADAAWEVQRKRVVVDLKNSNPDYARLAERSAALQAQVDAKTPGMAMNVGAGSSTPAGVAGVSTGGDGSGAAAALANPDTPDPDLADPATNPADGADRPASGADVPSVASPATRPASYYADKFDLDRELETQRREDQEEADAQNDESAVAADAPREQVAQAAEVLELKQVMDAMEDAAILRDEKAVAAKNAYEAAAAKTTTLDEKLRAQMLNDPEYQQAQQQLEQAQARLSRAAAYDG